MTFLRNLPILLWWLGLLIVLVDFGEIVFTAVLLLILAAPFYRAILVTAGDSDVLPVSSAGKFSALMSMTTLGLMKAGMANRKFPSARVGKILDRSPMKGEKKS